MTCSPSQSAMYDNCEKLSGKRCGPKITIFTDLIPFIQLNTSINFFSSPFSLLFFFIISKIHPTKWTLSEVNIDFVRDRGCLVSKYVG